MATIEMKGTAALITGAASGLGRATALRLAEAGADLFLVDVNEGGLAETAGLVSGVQVATQTADLSDPDACAPVVAAAVARFGRLDALCNVAGLVHMGHATDMPREQYERIMAVNLNAVFFLSQAAIPHLLEANGAIVNVASSAAHIGEAYAAAYCASKWGVLGLTKAMAMEFIRQPIRINAVAPGGMMTNIGVNLKLPPDVEGDLIKRYSGLRGLVEVADVADQIALLASPAGRGFHGACINIDGGITAG